MAGQVGLVRQDFATDVARTLARMDLHVVVQACAQFKAFFAQVTLVQKRRLLAITAPVAVP